MDMTIENAVCRTTTTKNLCRQRTGRALLTGTALISSICWMQAATIAIPGGSFESPAPFPGWPVNTSIDSWQESPQPGWYDPMLMGGYSWDQLSGVFPNPPPSSPANHIDNMHGSQAAYLFAVPGVALFQDYGTMDWDDGAPTHAFDARFEVGNAYRLTVGVIGGSGLGDGASLQISLYYRDGLNNIVPVGSQDIIYSAAAFPNITHFSDYEAVVPVVQAGDAWAGQNIGVSVMVTSPGGAYWDIDNVRLTVVPEPGTVTLLALGLGGVLAAWRRTRR